MRVLLVNTSERIGGAAIATSRLMEALKNNGIKAKMLVRDKQTDQITVVSLEKSWLNLWRFIWERSMIWKANRFKRNNLFAVDLANTGIDITALPEFQEADVIHLNWVNQGMLSLKKIQKIIDTGKPIVWTMHDMWCFTGICHYSDDCKGYMESCGKCPFIYHSTSDKDISHRVFMKKEKILHTAHISFVACSRWLEKKAKESKLLQGFPVTSIPNAINTNLFHPHSKKESREAFNLPLDKKLLLFGSLKISDERKGFKYLVEACRILHEQYPDMDNIGVVVFGRQTEQISNLLPFPIYCMDYISEEKQLANIYNAVDLYVTPSLQDNLPNTIVEAMACGIPCIGFNTGGIPEMIDHQLNGYVAEYKSAADFAQGIHWTLIEGNYEELSRQACKKAVSSYSESSVAMKYIELYNKVTKKNA